jgi:hypothetical protein
MMRKIQTLAAFMFAISMSGYANTESLPDNRRVNKAAHPSQAQTLKVYDGDGNLVASFNGQSYAEVLQYVQGLPEGTYTISDTASNSATADRRIIVYTITS